MKVLDRRYELRSIVREYAFGRLWLAEDLELARPVTIREVSGKSRQEDAGVQKLVQISHLLTQVPHPNVEGPIVVREDSKGDVYVIYPHYRSITLRSLIEAIPRLNVAPEVRLYILGQVARGMAAAHQARDRMSNKSLGLYHLGLAPESITLTEQGAVQIVDFGISATSGEHTVDQAAYLAPEQIEGSGVDQAADIFSLGAIGFELFTGRRLLPQQNLSELMAATLKGQYNLEPLRAAVSGEIFAIMDQCLRRRKADRFQSAVAVADRINAILTGKLTAPEKKIGEYVEKLFETPKLRSVEDARQELVKTELFSPERAERKAANMNSNPNDDKGKKRPRPGEETVIRSIPVGERLKRMQPGNTGGRKLLVILSILAGVLAVGLLVVLGIKFLGSKGETPVTEMESGRITTIPDSASVFLGDSLVGVTPGTFTLKPGELIRIRHECCTDTLLPVDFDQFADEAIYLQSLIEITSIPEGAQISINGETVEATTPYQLRIRPDQSLEVKLELPNRPTLEFGSVVVSELPEYQSDEFDITLLPDGGYRLVGAFGKKPETVPQTLLTSAPTGAKVLMGGDSIGETPLRHRFGANSTKLTIVKDGYEDRIVNLPAASSRHSKYHFLLFRRVYITAYQEGQIDNTVPCRIKNVIYEDASHEFSEMTPAYIRLPGVECRIILAADGYLDTDTLIAPAQRELTAVMRVESGAKPQQAEATPKEPASDESQNANKATVKIFVTDKKDVPVPGAAVTAELRSGDGDETLELGTTDDDGKLEVYLDPAKYKFIAKHIDFKLGDESKEVRAGQSYILTIKIKRR